jgi:hypothetical protein
MNRQQEGLVSPGRTRISPEQVLSSPEMILNRKSAKNFLSRRQDEDAEVVPS